MTTPGRPTARRLWRGLGWRLLAVSVGVGALAATLMSLAFARVTLEVAAERMGAFVRELAKGPLGDQCRADPDNFVVTMPDGSLVWTLDAALQPPPTAPPLDEDLRARLRAGETEVAAPILLSTRMMQQRSGGVLVARVAPTDDVTAPCPYVAIQWPRSPAHRERGALWALLAVGVAVLLASGLGLFLVVRPLLRRIADVEGLARRVGDRNQPPLVASARNRGTMSSGAGDELQAVAATLIDVDVRLRADAAALEQKNDALRAHLADVAHDLRTPLAALQLRLESLRQQAPEPVTNSGLAEVLADALALEAIIENLRLSTALREGVPLEQASSDLVDVVTRVVQRLRPVAEVCGAVVDVAVPDDGVRVAVSRVVVERMVGNLIDNAIRHGGGQVAVIVATPTPSTFTLQVLDDGEGFDPTTLPGRDQAAPRADGGSGLGWSIVTSLASSSGWEVVVGRGAVDAGSDAGFVVSLHGQRLA